jgi:peptidoglycan/LPS O-acetylase OafA/YrhL
MNTTPSEHVVPLASSKEGRMPQLDGLRAFAVLGVMWYHWVPEYRFGLPWASGVSLFFVLSGFLITGILFDARFNNESRWWSLRQFYARRILRIWPIFYLTIAIGVLTNYNNVREVWLWHATYLTNFLTSVMQYRSGPFQHFWSLSVEEQFYICWPLIMLFIPRSRIRSFIILTIISSPIFRVFVVLKYPDIKYWHMLPFSCLDMLGMGALLAYVTRFESGPNGFADRLVKVLGWIGIPFSFLIGGYRVLNHGELPLIPDALRSIAISMCFGWLVYNSAKGFKGRFGGLLETKWLTFIGKISYGLYIYHMFTPAIVDYFFGRAHIPLQVTQPVVFRTVIYGLVTLAMAVFSWFVIERPINSLKRFFPYARRNTPSNAPVVAAPQPRLNTIDAA